MDGTVRKLQGEENALAATLFLADTRQKYRVEFVSEPAWKRVSVRVESLTRMKWKRESVATWRL